MKIPDNWASKDNGIFRRLVFNDFSECLSSIVRIGIEAEKMDHHPEWSNVCNRLEIFLTTHETGGLSTKDIVLAKKLTVFLTVIDSRK